jgi:hypothetical protein
MFKLSFVTSQSHQANPRPELIGGSIATAMNSSEALKLKAVNELLKWISVSVK